MVASEIRLTFVALELLCPPLARFRGTQLPDLFAKLSKRHRFETFEHRDSGAALRTEGERELTIARERLRLEENVQVGFELLSQNFEDIVGTVKSHFDIPVFAFPQITVRGLIPVGGNGDANKVLLERALSVKEDQFEVLDSTVRGIGVRLYLECSENHYAQVMIEPYLADPTQIFLAMDSQLSGQVQTPAVVRQRLEEVYEYFTKRVVKLVETFI